jgi:hypothetical protein
VRKQPADLLEELSRRRQIVLGDALEHVPVGVLLQHGDEAEIVAALLLTLLQDREHVALDPRAEVVWTPLGDEHPPSLVQVRQQVLEDGVDKLVP